MESHTFADAYNEIVDQPVTRQGGYILVSDRPGIGIEIDESKLGRYPYRAKTIEGVFRHADGSVAH
jgi:L-alanine-DL-glutamate epimerase-like enolase superfamily enzyme